MGKGACVTPEVDVRLSNYNKTQIIDVPRIKSLNLGLNIRNESDTFLAPCESYYLLYEPSLFS